MSLWEDMMSRTTLKNKTFFDRLANPSWGLIGAVIISLVLLAVVAVGLDGLWGTVLTDVSLRRMLTSPVMVVYILIVTAVLNSYHDEEIASHWILTSFILGRSSPSAGKASGWPWLSSVVPLSLYSLPFRPK